MMNEKWLTTGEGEIFHTPDKETALKELADKVLSGESDSFRARLISVLLELSDEQLAVLADISRKLASKQRHPQ